MDPLEGSSAPAASAAATFDGERGSGPSQLSRDPAVAIAVLIGNVPRLPRAERGRATWCGASYYGDEACIRVAVASASARGCVAARGGRAARGRRAAARAVLMQAAGRRAGKPADGGRRIGAAAACRQAEQRSVLRLRLGIYYPATTQPPSGARSPSGPERLLRNSRINLVGARGFEPPTFGPEPNALPGCATPRGVKC